MIAKQERKMWIRCIHSSSRTWSTIAVLLCMFLSAVRHLKKWSKWPFLLVGPWLNLRSSVYSYLKLIFELLFCSFFHSKHIGQWHLINDDFQEYKKRKFFLITHSSFSSSFTFTFSLSLSLSLVASDKLQSIRLLKENLRSIALAKRTWSINW